jgi:hypothetical protein
LLQCDEVSEFLQFLVQGGEFLVGLLSFVWQWREIPLLSLGSELWHMVRHVLLMMVQRVGMGLGCEIALRRFSWYILAVVVEVGKC